MANLTEIRALLQRYSAGKLSPDEEDLLVSWINDPEKEDTIQEILAHLILENEVHAAGSAADNEARSATVLAVDKGMGEALRPVHHMHFLRKWSWAAASIIVLLGIGAYLWNANKKNNGTSVLPVNAGEIRPGKDGAILTLADGTQVVLDSLGNGVIASQNGAKAVLKDGGLTYDPTGNTTGETVYNTMSTPKGRQFHVTLPDGTQVWLNSASSISYPTVFAGGERMVSASGEAYFEVAKNAKMPFKVNVNNKAEVKVLGTHFNMNAYDNEESITTTLLEGSVTVTVASDRPQAILKPGQQAQIFVGQKTRQGMSNKPADAATASGKIKVIDNADIDKVMAWKNGFFNFEGATLEEVMRQLERWYDIDVVYEKNIPDIEFGGKLTKDISLTGLLNALERSDVNFRIEGRKLTVLP